MMRDIGKISESCGSGRVQSGRIGGAAVCDAANGLQLRKRPHRPDVEQILHLAEIFGADANAVLYGPPVPESRRRAVSRAVVGGGMTAMLWTGFLLLRRWVTALVTYNYQILPGVILSVCWKPLMWGVTGWTLSQLLSLGHLLSNRRKR